MQGTLMLRDNQPIKTRVEMLSIGTATVIVRYSLAAQHQRQTIHLGDLLLCIDLLVLERPYDLHAVEHLAELMASHTQRLKQRHVHLQNESRGNLDLIQLSINI